MEIFAVLTVYSALITKIVDFVRTTFDKADNPKFKPVWIILPWGLGIALALLYELNYVAAIEGLPERLGNLSGTAAQIVTGAALGAYASGLHELFDALSGVAKRGIAPTVAAKR